jgi:pilus assembly protein CpaB
VFDVLSRAAVAAVKIRRIPLIIGLVLALGTGALLLTYLTSLRPSGAAAQTRSVLVAVNDVPARASVTTDMFAPVLRNTSQIDSDAISDPKELAGTYTLVAIPAGSVVTHSKIGLASTAALPARLPIGMRAVSISIDNVKGVAGLITPGDRVDVIAVPPAGNEAPRGYAILRGALVLAMGADVQTTTAAPPGPLAVAPPSPTTVTLELTPAQADLLAGADLSTTLRLALRNPSESVGAFPAESLQFATHDAAPATNGSAPEAPPAAPPAATTPVQPNAGVTVIDGDRSTSGAAASP